MPVLPTAILETRNRLSIDLLKLNTVSLKQIRTSVFD